MVGELVAVAEGEDQSADNLQVVVNVISDATEIVAENLTAINNEVSILQFYCIMDNRAHTKRIGNVHGHQLNAGFPGSDITYTKAIVAPPCP